MKILKRNSREEKKLLFEGGKKYSQYRRIFRHGESDVTTEGWKVMVTKLDEAWSLSYLSLSFSVESRWKTEISCASFPGFADSNPLS